MMMTGSVIIERTGAPDVLVWRDRPLEAPGSGEAVVRHTAIGLNFIDVYHRTGFYPLPALPAVIGLEAAGRVEAIGSGVDHVAVGDRVAYAGGPTGAYSEARVIPADRLVKLPDHIDDRLAAAIMLKGMTAEYLLRRTHQVSAGETILFHAAAGGVGLLACQWATSLGATVIGGVGRRDKVGLAKAHGCDHVVVTSEDGWAAEVRRLTGGRGVSVVYDSVGRDTVLKSLDCLMPRGLLVSFGQASGPVPPLDIAMLSAKGSLYLTRPTLMTYTASPEDLAASAAALFDVIERGVVAASVRQTYPLREAARAHADLEARRTVGSTVLLP